MCRKTNAAKGQSWHRTTGYVGSHCICFRLRIVHYASCCRFQVAPSRQNTFRTHVPALKIKMNTKKRSVVFFIVVVVALYEIGATRRGPVCIKTASTHQNGSRTREMCVHFRVWLCSSVSVRVFYVRVCNALVMCIVFGLCWCFLWALLSNEKRIKKQYCFSFARRAETTLWFGVRLPCPGGPCRTVTCSPRCLKMRPSSRQRRCRHRHRPCRRPLLGQTNRWSWVCTAAEEKQERMGKGAQTVFWVSKNMCYLFVAV